MEGAGLESLVPNDQAVGLPEEDLDAIAAAVEEQEEMSGERILTKKLVHHSQKPVEAFSHVSRPGAKENAHGGGELREHQLLPSRAESLGKPVALWLSDRQDAFVTGIAAEFPGVPHRYCENHFLRDVAKLMLEADSHTKVQMRKKVRGLRKIEQAVLKQQGVEGTGNTAGDDGEATIPVTVVPVAPSLPVRWVPWCSTTAQRCVAFSTTIREDRSTLLACGWPKL